MKPTKHTPGPWVSHGFHDAQGLLTEIVTADDKYRIARVDGHAACNAEPTAAAEANARLIAAAPDLLEALTEIALECETADADALVYLQGILRTANKALAKARGES